MSQNPNHPNYRCAAFQKMSPAWKIVHDVEKGTLHLRAQGTTYLPKFPAEHKDDYQTRLNSATLFNAYDRTRNGLIGMVFKKPLALNDDVPESIRGNKERKIDGLIENIDLAGTHLDVFAKEVMEDAFDGHSFILVDMQKGLGPEATRADEIRSGHRPYWVKYKACQAVNWMPISINGQVEIGQITFEEEVSEPDGEYGEKCVLQYRTFKLVETSAEGAQAKEYGVQWVLKKKVQEEGKEETFELIDEGTIKGFNRIPVAVVYGRKKGFLLSQPVLLDLALINIKHYQKRSDYDQSLHKCGNPIPVVTGVEKEWNVMAAGSGVGLKLPKDATATYMEPQGNSLEAMRSDLQDLREEMAALGLSVLASRPQAKQTATETVIDFTQESSELETIARSEADAIELCLQFTAKYLGEKQGGSINLGTHLRSLTLTPQQVTAYSQMVAETQLPLEVFWDILIAGDALPADFNKEDALKKLFGALADQPEAVRSAQTDTTRQTDPHPPPPAPSPQYPPA